MGGLFGRRHHCDNSAAIRALIQTNEANHKRFLDLLERMEKSHKERMKILSEEINYTKEQNQKIIQEFKDSFKKKEEEYENKNREKKEKKILRQKQANEQLINDINLSQSLIIKECENDFDNLNYNYCLKEIENIKISDDIEELFINLFESEKSKKLFLEKILENIKYFKYNKNVNCYNIQIIGKTGVGKSTLINSLLRIDKAFTSFGRIGTYETQEYTNEKFPFIKFIDTKGTELSVSNNINKVEENTLNYIERKLSEEDPSKTIHCIFYCINSNRFEDIESKVLLTLRKKYKNGNLPIIIVYTQNYFEEDYEEMKKYINMNLKENHETEIGNGVEDINIVGVVAKKKRDKKPSGLDKLLNFLKLKAKNAFLIANVNMVKQHCRKVIEILLTQTLNNLLANLNIFFAQDNIEEDILYNTLKNVFLEYLPQDNMNLSKNGEKVLKNIVKKLSLEIDEVQKKKLIEYSNDSSEKIGLEIEKAQYNVINQNLGVKLNIKEFSYYKREGKHELEKILKNKSIKYSNMNFAKKIYEKSALKFKVLFKEAIDEIIENEKEINDLVINLNQNITEEITNKIDDLIKEIKKYQDGEID